MQVKTLEYFLEVADIKSISKAAERLYISQQGLSKAIAGLEKELGVQLFIRGQNGLELTNEGNVVAKHVSIMLREYSAMNNKLRLLFHTERQSERTSSGSRILVMPYILNCMFDRLQDDLREYQLDGYSLEEADIDQVLEIIENYEDNAHLAILAALPSNCYSNIIDSTRMQFFPLFSTEIAVFTPRKFTTPPYGRPLSAEEFSQIPLALFDDLTLARFVRRFFEGTPYSLEPVVQTKDTSAIRKLLLDEKAAILTDTFSLHVSKRFKSGVIRVPESTLKLYVGFFTGIKVSKNDPERQYMVRFQEMIKERYGMYAKQNQVPHPNYNWSFDGD